MALKVQLKRGSGIVLGKKAKAELPETEIAPVFESIFGESPAEPMDSPLDAIQPGDPEETCAAETGAILRSIIQENEQRRDAYRLMVDPEYFFCVCFQSRAQKDAFLKAVGWDDLGDKYLNGLEIAKRMGAGIEPEPVKVRIPRALSKRLAGIKLIGDR